MVPGLDIIPAGVDLSGAEVELVAQERRELILRRPCASSAALAITC